MNIVEFKEQNTVYAKDQPQYKQLPAYKESGTSNGRMVCCWSLTIWERIRLLFSGVIWHEVLTFHQPLQPLLLGLDKPDMPTQEAQPPAFQKLP